MLLGNTKRYEALADSADASLLSHPKGADRREEAEPIRDDVCMLQREDTTSTRASAANKAAQASEPFSELPSTLASREASVTEVSTKATREASAACSDATGVRETREASIPSVERAVSPLKSKAESSRWWGHLPRFGRIVLLALSLVTLVGLAVRWSRSSLVPPAEPQLRGSTHAAPKRSPVAPSLEAPGNIISAWELFTSPELHEAATENLMAVGQKVRTPVDREVVHASVAAGFKNMSSRLPTDAPAVAEVLNTIRLTEDQRDALLKTLRLLSDLRVQSIGIDVAKAIRESPSKDTWSIVDRIHHRLRPRAGEIRMLADKLIPQPLQKLTHAGHHWGLTLQPANLQAMSNVGDSWAEQLGTDKLLAPGPAEMLPQFRQLGDANPEKGVSGVEEAVAEQGRYLLNILMLSVDASGKDKSSSPMLGVLHPRVVSCSGPSAAVAALLCPLKFGTQGVDALRAIVEIHVLRR